MISRCKIDDIWHLPNALAGCSHTRGSVMRLMSGRMCQARIREVYPEHADADYKELSKKLEHARGAAAAKRAEIDRLEREMASLNDEVNRKASVPQNASWHRFLDLRPLCTSLRGTDPEKCQNLSLVLHT